MKLSAPPPPPPPPPGDGNLGGPAPNPADDPNNPNARAAPEPTADPAAANTPNSGANATATAPDAVPSDAPAPAPVVKVLQWPSWYGGVDGALVALVLVFAFAAASFVARNSDLWLHLATGKRLFAGQYTPGTDPFSYSAADRPWVNHSWLVDAVSYVLYGEKGKVLVIAKAVVVALTFGLLIAIRRPKFSLWPWAAVAAVAVLTAAPQFVLRPLVVSMLFLSVTLYLLFRMPQKPNSWRFPLAIGATFWFWANSDPWFVIGPLALALLILGDLIQTKLLNAPDGRATPGTATAADDEPLGRLPDPVALAKALGVGVLACMLNPHHFRVWELPFELVGAPGVEIDPRLKQQLYSPLSSDYFENPGLGYNLNGLAYAILLVAGAGVLGFGAAVGVLRGGTAVVRGPHIALWIGLAGLSLFSVSAVPFFALVAVPLVAAELNALGAGLVLKGPTDTRSRLFLYSSSLGRIACVLGVCALCVAAYPGWVHPDASNPALARRFAWGVEPEPSLARGAEQFHQWHQTDRLPADARGMIANTELANYVAWFAPEEKVFINTRFNHHRSELADYLDVRRGLGLLGAKDDRPNPADATAVLERVGAQYVAIHAGPNDFGTLRSRAAEATVRFYGEWTEWSPWYTDGRTTVFGWCPTGAAAKPTFRDLRVDPVVLAFGPNVVPLEDPNLRQPPPQLGWEAAFVQPPQPAPLGNAEAAGWLQFQVGPQRRQVLRQRAAGVADVASSVPLSMYPTGHRLALVVTSQLTAGRALAPLDPDASSDAAALQAVPLLALRAARRSIAENPDHPDAYLALYWVLNEPNLPFTEGERTLGQITALRQCLERLPDPENYRRGQYAASPTDVASRLANAYLGRRWPPDGPDTKKSTFRGFTGVPLDVYPLNELLGQSVFEDRKGRTSVLVRQPISLLGRTQVPATYELRSGRAPMFLALESALDALKKALAYAPVEFANERADGLPKWVPELEDRRKDVETAIVLANDQIAGLEGRPLPELVEAAAAVGLDGKAWGLLTKKDMEKEYKERAPVGWIKRIGLALAVGRIEDANELIAMLNAPQALEKLDPTGQRRLQALSYQVALQGGQYKTAGELLEATEGREVGLEPLLAKIAQLKIESKILAQPVFPIPPLVFGAVLPSVAAFPPFESIFGRYLQAREAQELIGAKLQQDAQFFYRRGLLSLLEGDIGAARERFVQAQRKPPPGWQGAPGSPQVARYLQLIERAAQRSTKP